MPADPDMVAALAVACCPLVPYVPPRCGACGQVARTVLCLRCSLTSAAAG